ncbi:MAG: glucose-1-phosphate adenylyltransferase subunit GlgD [Clostridiales bacterium]|nr:glucose-1-phosphate adenylyltransferase subunit GlgD [Clostridiales bacterium]
MISNAFGLIYTGESTPQLKELTLSRAVAAVPFGGRYRCIDFILSNMVNSGITNVGLLTQKNYHSLMDHLGAGKEWDLHRKREGLFILPPFMTKSNVGLYRGTVDALHAAIGYIRRSAEQYVILSGSHTVFNMRFNDMLEKHIQSGADLTILYNERPTLDPASHNGDLRLTVDGEGRVMDMELNPYRPKTDCQSCDVFIFDKGLLEYLVEEAYARGEYDFLRDVILRKYSTMKTCGYKYDGYVARLDSLLTYFKHSMELLAQEVAVDLFDKDRIFTKVKDEVSAKYGNDAKVSHSILADGCLIDGTVENSVIFRGVKIAKGAKVSNSIVMQGVTVGEDAVLDHVILDKGVVIRPTRMLVGYDNFPIIIKKNHVV